MCAHQGKANVTKVVLRNQSLKNCSSLTSPVVFSVITTVGFIAPVAELLSNADSNCRVYMLASHQAGNESAKRIESEKTNYSKFRFQHSVQFFPNLSALLLLYIKMITVSRKNIYEVHKLVYGYNSRCSSIQESARIFLIDRLTY